MAERRRLVLVGGGLAHLQVLREWRRRPLAGVELVLVSPHAEPWYSGMVPGYLGGTREAAALTIPLAAVARCAGARLLLAAADRVSRTERVVDAGGERVEFDACSLDVGAGAPDAPARAVSLRPMHHAAALRDRLDALAAAASAFDVVVVGAGAGGVEVALAAARRLQGAADGRVTLVDAGTTLLPHEPSAVRARVTALLRHRGIGVVLGSPVRAVDGHAVQVSSGATLPADLVIWTAGAAPPVVLAASDLPLDAAGFLRVDRHLRVVDGDGVWGAGDCIVLDAGPSISRSGANAMRQGAVLSANLHAALGRGRPRSYRPRRRTLAILDTADERAIARWGSLHGYGGWAMALKRRIDERFVNRLREACDEKSVAAS